MVGYILSALLAMMPLPGLTNLPNGAEVRVVSPDLRTVYIFWRVEKGSLKLQAEPLEIPDGSRVRLLIRVGKNLHVYEGRYLEGDIYVETEGGYISVKQTFSDVYHIPWPDPATSAKPKPASESNPRPSGNSDQPKQNGNGANNAGGSENASPAKGSGNGGSNGGNGNGNGHNKGGRKSVGSQGIYSPNYAIPQEPLSGEPAPKTNGTGKAR